MAMNSFKYSFSQARKNIARNGLMSVASLFTTASCLIILGIFTVLTMNVNHITTQIKNQCEIQLFLEQKTDDTRVQTVKQEILSIPNVKDAQLYTREDMLAYAEKDMFGEDSQMTTGFEGDENPFPDSYKITLVDLSQTADTVKQLEKIQDTDYVSNEQEFVNDVVSISRIIKRVSMIVMAILLIIAVVIISNTVKLTVFNRRKEINIMKYIGATNRFIRIPFIIEGVLIGFLGAVVAFGLVTWGYIAMESAMKNIDILVITLVPYPLIAPVVAIIFIFTGCIIGMLGSLISMRKYLKV